MEKILVSACLIGVSCRYDGKEKRNEKVIKLSEKYNLIPICPEILGGLATPRPPAEIIGDKVINKDGEYVTREYKKGAEETLKIANLLAVKKAILKENSPSCGLGLIYDGSFEGKLIKGNGRTTDLLLENNIKVYGESNLKEL